MFLQRNQNFEGFHTKKIEENRLEIGKITHKRHLTIFFSRPEMYFYLISKSILRSKTFSFWKMYREEEIQGSKVWRSPTKKRRIFQRLRKCWNSAALGKFSFVISILRGILFFSWLQKWALPNNANTPESSFGKQKFCTKGKFENSIQDLKRIGKSLQTMKIEDLAKPAKMRSIIKSHNWPPAWSFTWNFFWDFQEFCIWTIIFIFFWQSQMIFFYFSKFTNWFNHCIFQMRLEVESQHELFLPHPISLSIFPICMKNTC